jgi:hypothetical protein
MKERTCGFFFFSQFSKRWPRQSVAGGKGSIKWAGNRTMVPMFKKGKR